MLPSFSHTAPRRESELIKHEYDSLFTRESCTILAGSGSDRTIDFGALLTLEIADASIAVASAAGAGNTGNGTLTLADPAFTSAVKEGVYRVTCTTAGADATSKFKVEGPDGKTVGTATGGAAFTGHVKFTIDGGGTDFVIDDYFEVTVTKTEESAANKAVAWAAGDDVYGISPVKIIAADGVDAESTALVRGPAIISASAISWPSGISDAGKEAAIDALRAKNIIIR